MRERTRNISKEKIKIKKETSKEEAGVSFFGDVWTLHVSRARNCVHRPTTG